MRLAARGSRQAGTVELTVAILLEWRWKMKFLPLLFICLLSACITVNVNYGTPRTAGETSTTRGGGDANGTDSDSDCDQQLRMAALLGSLAGSSSTTRILSKTTQYSEPTTLRMKRTDDQDDICLDDDSEVLKKQNPHTTRNEAVGLPGVEMVAKRTGHAPRSRIRPATLRLRQF